MVWRQVSGRSERPQPILFAGALVTGVVVFLLRRKAVAISIHAGIAITAYALLLAWNSLG